MERIFRGALRFSCTGFTYLRIASRLYFNAPSETSAHTGRRTSLRGLFCVPAIFLPKNSVYDIPLRLSASQFPCRVNDNTLLYRNLKAFSISACDHPTPSENSHPPNQPSPKLFLVHPSQYGSYPNCSFLGVQERSSRLLSTQVPIYRLKLPRSNALTRKTLSSLAKPRISTPS